MVDTYDWQPTLGKWKWGKGISKLGNDEYLPSASWGAFCTLSRAVTLWDPQSAFVLFHLFNTYRTKYFQHGKKITSPLPTSTALWWHQKRWSFGCCRCHGLWGWWDSGWWLEEEWVLREFSWSPRTRPIMYSTLPFVCWAHSCACIYHVSFLLIPLQLKRTKLLIIVCMFGCCVVLR